MHADSGPASSKAGGTRRSHTITKVQRLLTTTHCVGTMKRVRLLLILSVLLLCASVSHAAGVPAVVDTILGKYKSAGATWQGAIKQAATSIFWILATISLSWTCISMAIKRAEMGEFFAELCRFIMFTGFFFWLLTNGSGFANQVIASLWKIGGDAAGTGNSYYPGDLITLSMQVFQNTLQHVNFLNPESIVAPIIIALIILIVCALIAVNMILLLCAAWVVVYAGLIFLGFGGCRWTSDMAINYYRTVLGVGVSLMTMQLIIGIGIQFLKDLVASTGQNLDAGALAIIMVACIILAVIAHRLPQMVAGMVVGGGHNGAIGGVGVMTMLGTSVALTSMIGSAIAAARTAGGSLAANEANNLLRERLKVLDDVSAGSGSSGMNPPPSGVPGGGQGGFNNPPPSGVSGGQTGPSYRPGATNRPNAASSSFKAQTNKTPSDPPPAAAVEEEEPPLSRPMTPDEQRGFGPPTDPPE
jgi:type IV secretion system protein TrbL